MYDVAGRMIEILTVFVGICLIAFLISLVVEGLQVTPSEQFAQVWLNRYRREKEMEVYAAELIQATWRLYMLKRKAPEEVTVEVQLYLEQLIHRHLKFRQEHAMISGLSLDPSHDKALAMTRNLKVTLTPPR